ncbi:hypothetical protein DL546_009664 [Coniochaeta pulveracea]|uniref:Cyanovirin-N domain-containing protein n=1 Tax=Coniochaeta pulveracea TaxID=177199 RepID=A0A420YM99_9PEZI|nr:hypothetical protein DL546_009664 [Coniochaeta pulveracea]
MLSPSSRFTACVLHLAILVAQIKDSTAAALPETTVRQITDTGCCFAKNCEDWALQSDGRTVHGTCWDKIDQRHWYEVRSALDLTQCVTNRFGILAPSSPGGFDMSCRDCTLSGTVLSCQCSTPQTSAVQTSLDLNGFVTDDQGRLRCFNYQAPIISRRAVALSDLE